MQQEAPLAAQQDLALLRNLRDAILAGTHPLFRVPARLYPLPTKATLTKPPASEAGPSDEQARPDDERAAAPDDASRRSSEAPTDIVESDTQSVGEGQDESTAATVAEGEQDSSGPAEGTGDETRTLSPTATARALAIAPSDELDSEVVTPFEKPVEKSDKPLAPAPALRSAGDDESLPDYTDSDEDEDDFDAGALLQGPSTASSEPGVSPYAISKEELDRAVAAGPTPAMVLEFGLPVDGGMPTITRVEPTSSAPAGNAPAADSPAPAPAPEAATPAAATPVAAADPSQRNGFSLALRLRLERERLAAAEARLAKAREGRQAGTPTAQSRDASPAVAGDPAPVDVPVAGASATDPPVPADTAPLAIPPASVPSAPAPPTAVSPAPAPSAPAPPPIAAPASVPLVLVPTTSALPVPAPPVADPPPAATPSAPTIATQDPVSPPPAQRDAKQATQAVEDPAITDIAQAKTVSVPKEAAKPAPPTSVPTEAAKAASPASLDSSKSQQSKAAPSPSVSVSQKRRASPEPSTRQDAAPRKRSRPQNPPAPGPASRGRSRSPSPRYGLPPRGRPTEPRPAKDMELLGSRNQGDRLQPILHRRGSYDARRFERSLSPPGRRMPGPPAFARPYSPPRPLPLPSPPYLNRFVGYSHSPPRRPPSPGRQGFSPPYRAMSPPRRAYSPPRRPLSPRRRSLSPLRRPFSPPRRSFSPPRRPLSPSRRPLSPGRRPLSPEPPFRYYAGPPPDFRDPLYRRSLSPPPPPPLSRLPPDMYFDERDRFHDSRGSFTRYDGPGPLPPRSPPRMHDHLDRAYQSNGRDLVRIRSYRRTRSVGRQSRHAPSLIICLPPLSLLCPRPSPRSLRRRRRLAGSIYHLVTPAADRFRQCCHRHSDLHRALAALARLRCQLRPVRHSTTTARLLLSRPGTTATMTVSATLLAALT